MGDLRDPLGVKIDPCLLLSTGVRGGAEIDQASDAFLVPVVDANVSDGLAAVRLTA